MLTVTAEVRDYLRRFAAAACAACWSVCCLSRCHCHCHCRRRRRRSAVKAQKAQSPQPTQQQPTHTHTRCPPMPRRQLKRGRERKRTCWKRAEKLSRPKCPKHRKGDIPANRARERSVRESGWALLLLLLLAFGGRDCELRRTCPNATMSCERLQIIQFYFRLLPCLCTLMPIWQFDFG